MISPTDTEEESLDAYFMQKALQEAQVALNLGEVPVGAIIVCKGRLIAKAHNQCEQLTDSSAHAEMLAMTSAAHYLGNKYLNDCTLYVTLEPCAMCAAAMGWAQLQRIVYAAHDMQRGFNLWDRPLLHPRTRISQSSMRTEAEALLHSFFSKLRRLSSRP